MQVTFIVNSKARKLSSILKELHDYFFNIDEVKVSIQLTHHGGHAIKLAEESTAQSDFLIAVGGDGTLSEVLNGMMACAIPINEYPVLGLLPRGSANDFAKTCNAPDSISALKAMILAKKSKKIDIGKVRQEEKVLRYFINITGLGLSPLAVQNLEKSSKPLGAPIAYVSAILKSFFTYKSSKVKCESEDWTWEGDILQVAIANGRYYGDGICVAPDAQLNDGQFEVCIFGNLSVWDYLKNLNNLKKGITIDHPEAHYYRSKEIKITPSSTSKSGIESDGEYVGEVPVVVSVIPEAIKFLDNG